MSGLYVMAIRQGRDSHSEARRSNVITVEKMNNTSGKVPFEKPKHKIRLTIKSSQKLTAEEAKENQQDDTLKRLAQDTSPALVFRIIASKEKTVEGSLHDQQNQEPDVKMCNAFKSELPPEQHHQVWVARKSSQSLVPNKL